MPNPTLTLNPVSTHNECVTLECGDLGGLDVDVTYTCVYGDIRLKSVSCLVPYKGAQTEKGKVSLMEIGEMLKYQCENVIIDKLRDLHETPYEVDVDSKGVKA